MLFVLVGAVLVAVVVIALLSIDQVADLFRQRATLEQSYDMGHTGRFGSRTVPGCTSPTVSVTKAGGLRYGIDSRPFTSRYIRCRAVGGTRTGSLSISVKIW